MPSETQTVSHGPLVIYGPIVNPRSISCFQALPRCLLLVGTLGEIVWIEEDVQESTLDEVLTLKGSLDLPLIRLKHGEFLLPGFVDTHTVCAFPIDVPRRGD